MSSTLPFFRQCPPGLGGNGCEEATCNSTFVDPTLRILKSANSTACSKCDDGFGGLNCNICKGLDSCDIRQTQVNRGVKGVAKSSSAQGQSNGLANYSINNTLTCNNQPRAITASYLQCDVEQATLSALFPGNLTITGIKVANVPNFTATGMAEWDAVSNSSYLSVFLDGVEQFYCQAENCASSNTTDHVQSSTAQWGTDLWHCSSFSCSCIETAKICSNPSFPLASIINSIGGSLDFPCDFVDPNNPFGQTQCKLSTAELNKFVGPDGLALRQCSYGSCVSQYDLEQDWQNSFLQRQSEQSGSLSNGVIAGLAILGASLAVFLVTLAFGYYLRRKASLLQRIDDRSAIGLAWKEIHYHADSAKSTTFMHKVPRERIQLKEYNSEHPSNLLPSSRGQYHILRGITSYALPGTLNFIIGPSGAGKSSLVDVLAGREKVGTVTGKLSWLSKNESHNGFEHRLIAVVDQDDSINLPGFMTVREALQFAAELSVPENVPKHERVRIVDETLQKLGLSQIANHRIGDARSRGISGGERRRLSLAVALVGQPKILIADECTSGLDAFSAQKVITALRDLACGINGGTTIIATLHQPSSQIFDLADRVILLSRGQTLFDGPPSASLDFCEKSGVPVPRGHNVADHMLALAFEGPEHQKHLRDTVLPDDFVQSALPINHGSRGSQTVTTFITQLHALTARSLLMTKREKTGAIAHILGSAIVSVFIGACFFKVKLDLGGFQNRVGSMFVMTILILFSSLSAVVGLAKMRLLMMRERANGLYSPWSWVAAHLTYELVLLRAIPTILMVCIIYWMVGLRSSASDFFQFILIMVVFAWVIAIYNMILAAYIEDLSTAILLAAVYILFNIFMAGFVMSLNSMPSVVKWLRWIVPSKYALEAVADNQLQGLQFIDTFAGVPVRTDVSLFANKLFGFEDGAYYRDLIVLACGFLIGFSFLLFLAVWWRMRELR
ncbi:uncharacterized protein FA14DRAFT_151646 [Meira miltonrushii]|uniref:ABC transporter domain-containing protein n=1 Tax=Meira miltonrushii TaxID=1280837 RepID=A0A316V1B1_9BASI|nr:uncharacterized protein FA14DRAFT_151646 [Meira miltonrushii]PWN31340.1 hypothetical protein FA14DRAFT_151646 [Meira miltonrushii]